VVPEEPSGGDSDIAISSKRKVRTLKSKTSISRAKTQTYRTKETSRRLIELGGLIVKAELEELNNNTLLGALLSLKSSIAKQ
jgi:hypothetical protein